jgi:hypothetical protein
MKAPRFSSVCLGGAGQSTKVQIETRPVDFAGVVAETLELVRGSLPANIPLDACNPMRA